VSAAQNLARRRPNLRKRNKNTLDRATLSRFVAAGGGAIMTTARSTAAEPATSAAPAPTRGAFDATRIWIFDLDNTLYPAACNLFAEVDHKMGAYVAQFLDVPYGYARYLQKAYYRQFGTTLAGLMQVHRMEPGPFLDFVHDIDVSRVAPNPTLGAAIRALPGRKLIFTNGTVKHAENVAGRLGILHEFEAIYDIVASDYVPKPHRAPYDKFLRDHGVTPADSAMFEDMPHNLEVPHDLGMATVLVHSADEYDSPVQARIRSWQHPPTHIHHMTNDLTTFLQRLTVSEQG
jgi:putative hydrolase of the HAD superfamily